MPSGTSVDETGGETDTVQGMEVAESQDAAIEFPAWDTSANIFVRLLRARADAKRMEKKGEHKDRDGKRVMYNYVLGDDITQEGNRLFVKHGICPIPTAIDRHEEALQKGIKTTIKCRLHCYNADNPDECVVFDTWGTGIDYSDKGDGKAFSYAIKYAIAKALGLNTSDDIEDHAIEYEARPSDAAVARETAGVQKTKKAWAETFKMAVQNAQTGAELKDIQRNNRSELMSDDLPEVTRDFFVDMIEERKRQLEDK